MRYVVDASAAVEYLLRTAVGQKVAGILEIQETIVVAPALLDVEVVAVLRRIVLHRQLDEQRASLAIMDLMAWPIDRIPHQELILEAWRLRPNLSAYDAFYVALARLSKASLLTTDGPLSRAPNLGVDVHNIRGG